MTDIFKLIATVPSRIHPTHKNKNSYCMLSASSISPNIQRAFNWSLHSHFEIDPAMGTSKVLLNCVVHIIIQDLRICRYCDINHIDSSFCNIAFVPDQNHAANVEIRIDIRTTPIYRYRSSQETVEKFFTKIVLLSHVLDTHMKWNLFIKHHTFRFGFCIKNASIWIQEVLQLCLLVCSNALRTMKPRNTITERTADVEQTMWRINQVLNRPNLMPEPMSSRQCLAAAHERHASCLEFPQ